MRVELRIEVDEHEYAVTLEADQSVGLMRMLNLATEVGRLLPDPEALALNLLRGEMP